MHCPQQFSSHGRYFGISHLQGFRKQRGGGQVFGNEWVGEVNIEMEMLSSSVRASNVFKVANVGMVKRTEPLWLAQNLCRLLACSHAGLASELTQQGAIGFSQDSIHFV